MRAISRYYNFTEECKGMKIKLLSLTPSLIIIKWVTELLKEILPIELISICKRWFEDGFFLCAWIFLIERWSRIRGVGFRYFRSIKKKKIYNEIYCCNTCLRLNILNVRVSILNNWWRIWASLWNPSTKGVVILFTQH